MTARPARHLRAVPADAPVPTQPAAPAAPARAPRAKQVVIYAIDAQGNRVPDGAPRGTIAAYRFRLDVGLDDKGRRKQKMVTLPDLKAARAELTRLQAAVNSGAVVEGDKRITVAELVTKWLGTKTADKPSVQRFYLDALRPLVERHGPLPVTKLTSEHILAIRADMLGGALRKVGAKGKPLAPRTVNGFILATFSLFEYAGPEGLRVVPRNPATPRLVPRVPVNQAAHRAAVEARRGAWELEDAQAFLAAAAADRLHAAWTLTLLGMRRGEVLGLRWADIRFGVEDGRTTAVVSIASNRTVVAGDCHIGSPKSETSVRALKLPTFAAEALKALRAVQEREAAALGRDYPNVGPAALVVVEEDGRPPYPETYSDRFAALAATAGVPAITLHGARHHAATLLGGLGYPLAAVAKWLGQSQVSVTEAYTRARSRDVAAMSDAIGAALFGAASTAAPEAPEAAQPVVGAEA